MFNSARPGENRHDSLRSPRDLGGGDDQAVAFSHHVIGLRWVERLEHAGFLGHVTSGPACDPRLEGGDVDMVRILSESRVPHSRQTLPDGSALSRDRCDLRLGSLWVPHVQTITWFPLERAPPP